MFLLLLYRICVYIYSITNLHIGYIYVYRDGTSMTDSGYPRVMKEWRRGTSLRESKVVHEGEQSDVSVFMYMVIEYIYYIYIVINGNIIYYMYYPRYLY